MPLSNNELLESWTEFYGDFTNSLAYGEAAQKLEHDTVVHFALRLGKIDAIYNIYKAINAPMQTVVVEIAEMHAFYSRAHGREWRT